MYFEARSNPHNRIQRLSTMMQPSTAANRCVEAIHTQVKSTLAMVRLIYVLQGMRQYARAHHHADIYCRAVASPSLCLEVLSEAANRNWVDLGSKGSWMPLFDDDAFPRSTDTEVLVAQAALLIMRSLRWDDILSDYPTWNYGFLQERELKPEGSALRQEWKEHFRVMADVLLPKDLKAKIDGDAGLVFGNQTPRLRTTNFDFTLRDFWQLLDVLEADDVTLETLFANGKCHWSDQEHFAKQAKALLRPLILNGVEWRDDQVLVPNLGEFELNAPGWKQLLAAVQTRFNREFYVDPYKITMPDD